MARVLQNSTTYPARFLMVGSDGQTGQAGLTLTLLVCKNGATSFSAASGSAVDLGFGNYQLANATDFNTIGNLNIRASGNGTAYVQDYNYEVCANDPYYAATSTQIPSLVWDEPYMSHRQRGSFGMMAAEILWEGTIISGSNLADYNVTNRYYAGNIYLDNTAPTGTDILHDGIITIISGQASGITNALHTYTGSVRCANVVKSWAVLPASGDRAIITKGVGVSVSIVDMLPVGFYQTVMVGQYPSVIAPATPNVNQIAAATYASGTSTVTDKTGYGIDWGNILNKTSTNSLPNTTIGAGTIPNITAAAIIASGASTLTTSNIPTASQIAATVIASGVSYYYANIEYTRDDINNTDEYTVAWFQDGTFLQSGITSPTIQVIKRTDGSNLIGSTAMTQIGSTSTYKYDSTSSRQIAGQSYVVLTQASINGSTRTWERILGRDSASGVFYP